MDDRADLAVEYTLTEDDFVAFQEYTLLRRGFVKNFGALFMLPLIGVAVGALGVCAYVDRVSILVSLDALKATIFVAVFWGGVIWVTHGSAIRRSARRRFRDGTFANYLKPRRIKLHEAGIDYSSATGTGILPWSAVMDIATSNAALYFYTSSSQALIVPRRIFDEQAFGELVAAVRELWRGSGDAPASPSSGI